uniref:Uncharacterized protein n=1 Tax=Solanum lycopersicum TaxID=4081 RepID=A0A3Q7F7G1_SOLLC
MPEAISVGVFLNDFARLVEVLSSTSDVSLSEIVTKTHSRPNGYCKVLKAKCLYLGINYCRQDVGTTESPLCIPSVSFKIVHIERSVSAIPANWFLRFHLHAVRTTALHTCFSFPIAAIVQWIWESSEFP